MKQFELRSGIELMQRAVRNVARAARTANCYYDEFGHVVLETDGDCDSLREYIWLGDMPVAIIDEVETATPALYYVHADHLNRPILVTNGAGAVVWQAVWKPFGEPQSITGSLTYDARFPGQWFQIESGLNWNWNRHYDPATGRYVQPDPISTEMSDQTQAGALSSSAGYAGNLAHDFGSAWSRSGAGLVFYSTDSQPLSAASPRASDLIRQPDDQTGGSAFGNAVFADGSSRYAYARSSPLARIDKNGLISGPFTPRPSSTNVSSCNISCDDNLSHDFSVCNSIKSYIGSYLYGECSASAWGRYKACTSGLDMKPLLHFLL